MAAARARRAGASLLSAAVRHRSSQSSSPQPGISCRTELLLAVTRRGHCRSREFLAWGMAGCTVASSCSSSRIRDPWMSAWVTQHPKSSLNPVRPRCLWSCTHRLVAKTSLTSPPWPEVKLPDPVEEAKYHAEVVRKVNGLISAGQYGRLFAVVHFASKQWKITSEDLIMMDNILEAECGDRIRMEKVLLVGSDDFTLIGRPLLGKDLVRVEATVIEKTESWPKVNMRFWRRHNFQRKKIIANPQTVLRINTIEIYPCLS